MKSQDPLPARAVFDHAVEIDSPVDREAYVAQACARDGPLRREVEDLLDAYRQAGSFLESPSADLGLPAHPDRPAPPPERPGTVVGPYKLLELIGEGGMGVVYMAEQTRPVRRQVALKVIKAGMDTRQVIARFEAERQALAMMDHPNIARVLDAGATDSGRPYFVMELVKGVPITRYCDEHRLAPRARLQLFLQVCHAVQHAHTKGVIHRDLKPNNVLVASYDGNPVPKVIDFGVAKATGAAGRLTEGTFFTGFGALVGTPEYMSPEQAELNQIDVDTRSDVYSLGVILYELLTGTTPLEGGRVKGTALLDVLRVIREDEPPRPSTRLGTTAGSPGVASARGMEPKRLSRVVRGELDWIVMKALEKDRNRRYETALGLARDVERYLGEEPVAACPPSAAYRFKKLARRNRAALATAAGLALGALVAVAGLAVSNARIRQEAAAKQAALDAAKASKQDAVENLKDALRAVDQMTTRVARERPQQVSQLEAVRGEILQDAVTFYQKFVERGSNDPSIRQEAVLVYRGLGNLHHHFGRYAEAEASYRKAVELLGEAEGGEAFLLANPDAGIRFVDTKLGYCFGLQGVGKAAEAEATIAGAVELAEKLAERYPDDADVVAALVRASNFFASAITARDPGRAETILRRNLRLTRNPFNLDESHRALGDVYLHTRRFPQAEASYRAAAECAEQMLAQSPGTPWMQSCLANDLQRLAAAIAAQGRTVEAEDLYRRAIGIRSELAADFPVGPAFRNVLAGAHFEHADVLKKMGRLDDAVEACRRAADLAADLAADFPKVEALHRSAFNSSVHLGLCLFDAGRPQEALRALERAVALYENLAADPAARFDNGWWLAHAHLELGVRLHSLGHAPDAKLAFDRALDIHDRLAAAPEANARRAKLARVSLDTAEWLRGCDRPADAERLYRRAMEHFTALARESPDARQAREDLADAQFHAADYYRWKSDRLSDAEALFRQALRQYEKLSADVPAEAKYRIALADCRERLGSVLLFQGRLDPAANELTAAAGLAEVFAAEHPQDRTVRMTLAMASRHWAEAVRGTAPAARVEEAMRRADRALAALVAEVPANAWYRIEWGATRRMLALLLARDLGRPRDGEEVYRQAVAVFDGLVSDFPHDASHLERRAEAHREWGLYLRDAGHAAEANAPLGRAVADLDEIVRRGSDRVYDVWYSLALLQLATGRLAEYRALCEALVERHGEADPPNFWVVATCKLGPDALKDRSRAVRLAERLIAADPHNAELKGVLGDVLYRSGDVDGAVERLETSIRAAPGDGVHWRKLFLAMAYHRRGDAAQARKLLQEAGEWVDRNAPTTPAPDAEPATRLPWQLRLDIQLLRREAEELITAPVGQACGTGDATGPAS